MLGFILKRLLLLIPVLIAVDLIAFALVRAAPGGPFDEERAIPKEVEAELNAYYGYDKSWPEQYLQHLSKIVFHGDFGPSTKLVGYSVNEILSLIHI